MSMWSGMWATPTSYPENIGCIKLSWLNIHFRSDEASWKASSELLERIASHGEQTGFEVPCLIVAAKDDLDSFTLAIQDSIRVFFINLFICTIICIIVHAYLSVYNYWIVR
jgi:hypothetical protein